MVNLSFNRNFLDLEIPDPGNRKSHTHNISCTMRKVKHYYLDEYIMTIIILGDQHAHVQEWLGSIAGLRRGVSRVLLLAV